MSPDSPPPIPQPKSPPHLPNSHTVPATATPPAAVPRPPKAPLALGIMNLCFAVSGIGSSLFPILSSGQNPVSGASGSVASIWLFGIGTLVVALQIFASIGLIRLREWARQTTVILAGLQSLICLGGMAVITGILPLPGATETPAPVTSTDPSIQGKLEFLNAVFGTLGAIFKVVLITLFTLSLIYSLVQIILLTRPRVRQACQ